MGPQRQGPQDGDRQDQGQEVAHVESAVELGGQAGEENRDGSPLYRVPILGSAAKQNTEGPEGADHVDLREELGVRDLRGARHAEGEDEGPDGRREVVEAEEAPEKEEEEAEVEAGDAEKPELVARRRREAAESPDSVEGTEGHHDIAVGEHIRGGMPHRGVPELRCAASVAEPPPRMLEQVVVEARIPGVRGQHAEAGQEHRIEGHRQPGRKEHRSEERSPRDPLLPTIDLHGASICHVRESFVSRP